MVVIIAVESTSFAVNIRHFQTTSRWLEVTPVIIVVEYDFACFAVLLIHFQNFKMVNDDYFLGLLLPVCNYSHTFSNTFKMIGNKICNLSC